MFHQPPDDVDQLVTKPVSIGLLSMTKISESGAVSQATLISLTAFCLRSKENRKGGFPALSTTLLLQICSKVGQGSGVGGQS